MQVEALARVEGAAAGASVGAQQAASVFLQASIIHISAVGLRERSSCVTKVSYFQSSNSFVGLP